MKPELIIFDLDGVIVDSEPLHREAKLRIMRRLNLTNSVDLDAHIGRPNSELWNAVINENGLTSYTAADLEKMQYDSIIEQFRENGVRPSEGLQNLLQQFTETGIRLAVCSSSDRYYVDKVIDYFSLGAYFPVLVGGDEVERKKPAPDGYLLALERAGVPADRAVAIEDTTAGTASAAAAGLACVGYLNPTSGRQDLSRAFLRVKTLDEIARWAASGFEIYTGYPPQFPRGGKAEDFGT